MTSRKALGIIGYIDIDGRYPYPNYLKDRYKKEYDIIMEVVERDTPMKVIIGGIDNHGRLREVICPICHQWLTFTEKENFCPKCGKRLDWSE